ncbi:MAG: TIGR02996 domain-containing protein [Alphaproteobacteria bacterium]|nr:MAG: TIGR02996 domain-containing protein [Alphaproteobacteria bacterium]
MTDGDVILRAVLASPGDDLTRLAYADWLEESGELPRAELIRVQLEEARLHVCDCAPSLFVQPGCATCAVVKPLRRKAHKLLLGLTHHFRPLTGYSWSVLGRMPDGDTPGSHVRRGCVESVRLSCDEFLSHAEAIFGQHPVTKVLLSDLSPLYNVCGLWPAGYIDPSDADRAGWLLRKGTRDEFSLPAVLFDLLPPAPLVSSPGCWACSEEADALTALSIACIRYGRGIVGLPPLELEA